ncbi:hypothetical protein [Streptosporangium sp. NPDC000396]|uniref:hypothetical protein n=1 Tax=Streptosporangium sp. NPDC000396 TaxID=3366185 RepID=UPI003693FB71
MTASPAPDARVVAVTANSPGCLIICLASLTAIVGTFAWTVATDPALSGKIVAGVIALPFTATLIWFVIRIPAMRRGARIAVDGTGLWWSDGDEAYADAIPWDEVRAVAIGVWRGPRRTSPPKMSRYLEIYLISTEHAGRHPRLASKWYDVRPPEDLPDRCYRFHLVVPGAHDLLARAVRDRHPGLWIGEFEHTAAPALASRSE